jgi:SAM-dependent methyltransferase
MGPVSSDKLLDFYDAELRAHHEHLRAAYGICPGDEIVDIGCGAGLTTREAGRAAAPGLVVGIDISERMLARAAGLTATEGIGNVSYRLGNAQEFQFDRERFDLAISRFGVMFFSDPVSAFANIASALRFQGRLVALVWQRREHNEWAVAFDAALGDAPEPPQPTAGPFSLGGAEAAAKMLERAGFEAVRFEEVREPVFYGHDIDAALELVLTFPGTSSALAGMGRGDAARAVDRLRETLADHRRDGQGIAFESRSWLITARRA